MKVAIIEPLGIERQSVEKLQQEFLSKDIEVVYYDTAPKNDTEKIKRRRSNHNACQYAAWKKGIGKMS